MRNLHSYVGAILGVAASGAAAIALFGSASAQGPQVGTATVCGGALQASPNCLEAGDESEGGGTVYVDKFGAVVVDPDYKQMFWSLGADSQGEARATAIDGCGRATGKKCESLGTFWNQCLAYAFDEGGDGVFAGPASTPEKSAKAAMNKCASEGNGSACIMLAMPVCTGIQYSGGANRRAARATPADVEAYAAGFDKRQYWGALAANETGISRSFKYRTKAEAERSALSDCKGCSVIVSHVNSCTAVAWPTGQKNVRINEYAVDADPARAREQAQQKCQKKFGNCKTVWTSCSGRGPTDPYGDWK